MEKKAKTHVQQNTRTCTWKSQKTNRKSIQVIGKFSKVVSRKKNTNKLHIYKLKVVKRYMEDTFKIVTITNTNIKINGNRARLL
jgi:hypothetical protein